MTHQERLTALLHLYPTARLPEDVAFSDDGTGPVLTRWGLPGTPPTEAQLLAALPVAQAVRALRIDLRDTRADLEERVQMCGRALAWGDTATASEITQEITEIYKPYLRDLEEQYNAATRS